MSRNTDRSLPWRLNSEMLTGQMPTWMSPYMAYSPLCRAFVSFLLPSTGLGVKCSFFHCFSVRHWSDLYHLPRILGLSGNAEEEFLKLKVLDTSGQKQTLNGFPVSTSLCVHYSIFIPCSVSWIWSQWSSIREQGTLGRLFTLKEHVT